VPKPFRLATPIHLKRREGFGSRFTWGRKGGKRKWATSLFSLQYFFKGGKEKEGEVIKIMEKKKRKKRVKECPLREKKG